MSDPVETPNSEPPSAEPATPPSLITAPTETTNPEGEPKPSEGDPAPVVEAPVALTAEDITLPEGFEISETLRDEFLEVVNNGELSPKDRAQALVDLQTKAVQQIADANATAWTDMQKKWQDEVRADPAYTSDDKLQPALGRIGRLISEYGSEEVSGVFDLTGAGNNVHMVKFLDKIAQKLTEGVPIQGQPPAQERSAAQRLFPSMKG